jgi:Bacterial archaeo-eukaryotic release factor family 10
MTDSDRILADLARLQSHSEPIVSLYLDVRWRDEQQRERVRGFVKEHARRALGHYLPGSPGRDGLARTLAKVQDYVAGLASQAFEAGNSGLALFACESLGLWRPLFFGCAFQTELSTDAVPHLKPLARVADDLAPTLVVAPRQEGAEIYLVRLGEVDVEAELRGFVPRFDKDEYNPGAALPGRHYEREAKDERREEAWAARNRRAAASEVAILSDQRPGSRVVLVGTSGVLAAFERELPPRVRSRVVARAPRPREWESGEGRKRDGVKALAAEVLARRVEEEKRAVDQVVGEALRGAYGVVGPDDVVLALNEGRVHTLVIEDDFQRTGWRCDNCGALGQKAESAERCPFCEGNLHVVHDLGESLVARTLAEGGRVEVVAHTNKLHSYRGVAAFLRQTAATGLRGASPPWPTAPGANQP